MERLRHVFHTDERKVIVSIDRLDLCKARLSRRQAHTNSPDTEDLIKRVAGVTACTVRIFPISCISIELEDKTALLGEFRGELVDAGGFIVKVCLS